jgi:hypothetical protein
MISEVMHFKRVNNTKQCITVKFLIVMGFLETASIMEPEYWRRFIAV